MEFLQDKNIKESKLLPSVKLIKKAGEGSANAGSVNNSTFIKQDTESPLVIT